MQPCRFSLPAGWRLLGHLGHQGEPPASGASGAELDRAAAASGAGRPVVACLGPAAASAERRACLLVLAPVVPDGALLAQLGQGIEQDLAASAQAYGAQVVGRSAPQLTRLGAGAAGFQAVWLRYPARATAAPTPAPTAALTTAPTAAPATAPTAAPTAAPTPAPTPAPAAAAGEGRLYFLLHRRLGQSERRVPLLFIGGPDALPTHLGALEQIVSSLELSSLVAGTPQPVHAAWSD